MRGPIGLLRSKSQIARVTTELRGARELYCVACSASRLSATPPNTKAIDFFCPNCRAAYQLKSSSKPFGNCLPGASFAATVSAFKEEKAPHLFLLYYSENWTVNSLRLVPSFSIPLSAIAKRRPLGPNARRAGWVRCNIVLAQIPDAAKLNLVISGKVSPSQEVRSAFKRIQPFSNLEVQLRGWTLDVLKVIQNLPDGPLVLADIYAYEHTLSQAHPENRNVHAKIRQQLQILRDIGLLSFLGRGKYKVI